ncbi:MAG TPA: hypothetical protein VHL50_01575 [Pyrinomonadaceae bacterium]|nr:hypothetical protein [Pyrinomonadaceae bacterium]
MQAIRILVEASKSQYRRTDTIRWMYFFAIPVVTAVLIAICLALAFVSAKRTAAA